MTTLTDAPPAPPPPAAAGASPVAPDERVPLLDVLRGFAVFGILVVNILYFSGPLEWVIAPDWTAPHDRAASWLINTLFAGKFYTIFSLLFGLGFAIQLERGARRGAPVLGRYLRRLLVLFVIGLLHAAFVWYGDILHTYAFVGFFLILFRNVRPSRLLLAATIFIAIPPAIFFLSTAAAAGAPAGTFDASDTASFFASEKALEVYATGSWGEITRHRIGEWLMLDALSFFILPSIFAMFLGGLWLGKTRAWAQTASRRPLLWKIFVVALPIGLALNAAMVLLRSRANPMIPTWEGAWAQAIYTAGVPALAVAYMTGLALLWDSGWRRVLRPLAPVGRMALTNYLMQSVVCTLIFYAYGLGLYGSVGPWIAIPLALAIFAVQVAVSGWWFRRFRFGPVEWLWRVLTYGKWAGRPGPQPTSP